MINKGNPGNQNISGYSKSDYVPSDDEEISSLMDEAKTMWKVGSYHENIVNLQGISVNVEEGSIRRVSNLQNKCYKKLYSICQIFRVATYHEKTHRNYYLGFSHTGILCVRESQSIPNRT